MISTICKISILLCEIPENRAVEIMKKCHFNSRKYTSASSFSGCFHRILSKAIISLPTCYEHVQPFEKTLIGGFSCVRNRLAYDSRILFPKGEDRKFWKDLKLTYKVRNQENNILEEKRITTKIFYSTRYTHQYLKNKRVI